MSPLVDWYFEVCATKGKHTIVLIQVGGFYEAYSDEEGQGSAKVLSEVLRMHLTKKNSKKPFDRSSNPFMAGFPLSALQKHLTRLNDEGHEVVIIEQQDDNPKKRFIRGVYSDCIRMQFEDDDVVGIDNKVHCLLLEKYTVRGSRMPQDRYHVSIVILEMNTGKVMLDFVDTEEIDRILDHFVLKHQPSEVLLSLDNCTTDVAALLETKCRVSYDQDPFKDHEEIYYFRKAFPIPEGEDDSIAFLGLHRHQSLVQCLGRLLRWVQNHDPLLMQNLQIPEFAPSENVMGFNQDALTELNIMSICEKRRYTVEKQKQKSLFDILSATMNIMGKRRLEKILRNPATDPTQIGERLDRLEDLSRSQNAEEHCRILRGLSDLEWYLLRWKRNKLSPRLLAQLFLNYEMVCEKLLDTWSIFSDEVAAGLKAAVLEVQKTWDLQAMANTTQEMSHQDFARDRDEAHMKEFRAFETELGRFEAMVPTGKLILEKDRRCVIQLTQRSWKLGWDKSSFYEVEKKTSYVKISHPDLDRVAARYFSFREETLAFYKDLFHKNSEALLDRHGVSLEKVNQSLAELSCYLPLVHFFQDKGYTKPHVDKLATRSFVECRDFRHAIMEVIHPDHLFVPYSVVMGKEDTPTGLLIYGINSSGKSTMLKSMGICLWLAQCGLYVPAASMAFSPFDAIYTKIGIQDNLFLGHSTFVAEMNELMYILKRATPRTFVMCDELTSGTETKSATGIVAATLSHFLEKKLCFFFTTHLHTVSQIPELVHHPRLRICHFRIETKTNDLLVKDIRLRYDRALHEGSGDDMYGIEIAKSVGLSPAFVQQAFTFRERVQVCVAPHGKPAIQVSRYNRRFVLSECLLCGSSRDLHTHHITPQKEFGKGRHRSHTKDGLYNLVSLCQDCHHEMHSEDRRNDPVPVVSDEEKCKTKPKTAP